MGDLMPEQQRSQERAQCRFETEIAAKLRNAGRTDRLALYGPLYDQYAEAFPASVPGGGNEPDPNVGYEVAFARRFVSPDAVVAEVGPGRCAFAIALSAHCRQVYAIDVADHSPSGAVPSNFSHMLTDGIHIPLPDQSVDVVISNQLMEHLHPDDAADQLREVFRILHPGGRYICVTPNRLHGPHDSSARFDDLPCPMENGTYVANGLHLKEYTNAELSRLFEAAGFRRCRCFAGARGRYVRIPRQLMETAEAWLRRVPPRMRKRSRVLRVLLGVRMVAEK